MVSSCLFVVFNSTVLHRLDVLFIERCIDNKMRWNNSERQYLLQIEKKIKLNYKQRQETRIYILQWKLITEYVIRRTRHVSLLEQEQPTLPGKMCSLPVYSEVRVARPLIFCLVFCRSLFVILFFLSWLLRCLSFFWFMDSDYPFGILDLQILITPLVS